jgi:hypothetical protein
MSSTKTVARMLSRVAELSDGFEHFVATFAEQNLFTGPSLHFHLKTVSIRAGHATATETLSDPEFFESIYATLTTWGMHRMGRSHAKLAELREIRESFEEQATAIGEIEGLRLRDLSVAEAKNTGAKLWTIMGGLTPTPPQFAPRSFHQSAKVGLT